MKSIKEIFSSFTDKEEIELHYPSPKEWAIRSLDNYDMIHAATLMSIEDNRELFKQAIGLYEADVNKEPAIAFVHTYYDNYPKFDDIEDVKTLLLTFIALVVYEKKYKLKYGSTTPASFCYRSLLKREDQRFDIEFIFDVGDWAAEYSYNSYIPMGNYRGYGPRKYFNLSDD